ncbi:hypothetical protein B0H63DRAFT_443674 [Podospora didyma]|uniref:Uncharacterized protein n=1 Tax=Podospora didyma TaxID=330526 RepID=A0AAE0U738_9PEZI|nr:hypothetical protein B0H63DRAFT_443674 [Podospora didyma]
MATSQLSRAAAGVAEPYPSSQQPAGVSHGSFPLAQVCELIPAGGATSLPAAASETPSLQDVVWHHVPSDPVYQSFSRSASSSPESQLLVALWPTNTAADEQSPIDDFDVAGSTGTPLIHISPCSLDVSSALSPSRAGASAGARPRGCDVERVALPSAIVQAVLSQIELPRGLTTYDLMPHLDDANELVYTRCLLTDFTNVDPNHAAALSQEGRLCCWASVVLMLREGVVWDLGFVVHRVLTHRDPETGLCPCVVGDSA